METLSRFSFYGDFGPAVVPSGINVCLSGGLRAGVHDGEEGGGTWGADGLVEDDVTDTELLSVTDPGASAHRCTILSIPCARPFWRIYRRVTLSFDHLFLFWMGYILYKRSTLVNRLNSQKWCGGNVCDHRWQFWWELCWFLWHYVLFFVFLFVTGTHFVQVI